MTPEQVSMLQSAINLALARRDATAKTMAVQAVEELTAFYEAGTQKAAVARVAFEEHGEWLIETVWDCPQVWVPVIKTSRRPCFTPHKYHLTYRCGRPEGHTGRHARFDLRGFASGGWRSQLMRRVLAVWP